LLGGGAGKSNIMLIKLFFNPTWLKVRYCLRYFVNLYSCYFCVDGVPKLRDLVYELRGVDWHELGVQLYVPSYILINIGKANSDAARKLSDVLQYWLDNGDTNWKAIVEALNRIGKHGIIVTTIESKYIPSTRMCIRPLQYDSLFPIFHPHPFHNFQILFSISIPTRISLSKSSFGMGRQCCWCSNMIMNNEPRPRLSDERGNKESCWSGLNKKAYLSSYIRCLSLCSSESYDMRNQDLERGTACFFGGGGGGPGKWRGGC
jgi:hypothetical protein